MPKTRNYGYSEHTPYKQQCLARIFGMHLNIVGGIFAKVPWAKDKTYRYFDLTAGPGCHPEGGDGSPLIFLRQVVKRGFDYDAVLIEQNKVSADSLTQWTSGFANTHVYNGDHTEVLPTFLHRAQNYAYGLLYVDPTGVDVPWELLKRFVAYYPRVDILIHVAANNLKRVRKVYTNWNDLITGLDQIGKGYWLAQDPDGRPQWTFLLGTDYDGMKCYPGIGVFRTDSPKGEALLTRLSSTKEESRETVQPFLLPVPQL